MKYSPILVSLTVAVAPLFGCSKTSSASADEAAAKTTAIGPMAQDRGNHQNSATQSAESGTQIVAITVNENGFTPSQVEVKHGGKATLRFTRTTDKTCATAVDFPELGLNKPLPINQPVDIEIPSNQARTLTFQCGMGMFKSKVVVL